MDNEYRGNENIINMIKAWRNALISLILIAMALLSYQIWVALTMPIADNSTPIAVNLEGDGVIDQSFDLNLKDINAQQTVVLTELNTESGVPIAVKVSTDTSDQGVNHVQIN